MFYRAFRIFFVHTSCLATAAGLIALWDSTPWSARHPSAAMQAIFHLYPFVGIVLAVRWAGARDAWKYVLAMVAALALFWIPLEMRGVNSSAAYLGITYGCLAVVSIMAAMAAPMKTTLLDGIREQRARNRAERMQRHAEKTRRKDAERREREWQKQQKAREKLAATAPRQSSPTAVIIPPAQPMGPQPVMDRELQFVLAKIELERVKGEEARKTMQFARELEERGSNVTPDELAKMYAAAKRATET